MRLAWKKIIKCVLGLASNQSFYFINHHHHIYKYIQNRIFIHPSTHSILVEGTLTRANQIVLLESSFLVSNSCKRRTFEGPKRCFSLINFILMTMMMLTTMMMMMKRKKNLLFSKKKKSFFSLTFLQVGEISLKNHVAWLDAEWESLNNVEK